MRKDVFIFVTNEDINTRQSASEYKAAVGRSLLLCTYTSVPALLLLYVTGMNISKMPIEQDFNNENYTHYIKIFYICRYHMFC